MGAGSAEKNSGPTYFRVLDSAAVGGPSSCAVTDCKGIGNEPEKLIDPGKSSRIFPDWQWKGSNSPK